MLDYDWLSLYLALNKELNDALRHWMMSEAENFLAVRVFVRVCQDRKGISCRFCIVSAMEENRTSFTDMNEMLQWVT